jgi:methylthioribose-1-phosphate isomerase
VRKPQQRHNDDKEKPLSMLPPLSLAEQAVAGASIMSVISSIAAMIVESNPIVYISGLLGIVIAPYAAIQQSKITQVVALAETNERGMYVDTCLE